VPAGAWNTMASPSLPLTLNRSASDHIPLVERTSIASMIDRSSFIGCAGRILRRETNATALVLAIKVAGAPRLNGITWDPGTRRDVSVSKSVTSSRRPALVRLVVSMVAAAIAAAAPAMPNATYHSGSGASATGIGTAPACHPITGRAPIPTGDRTREARRGGAGEPPVREPLFWDGVGRGYARGVHQRVGSKGPTVIWGTTLVAHGGSDEDHGRMAWEGGSTRAEDSV
jgi:hypothetical protein